MGLLDKIKPQGPQVRPIDLDFDADGVLHVRWDDGIESRMRPRWLRARCPCAACVEEWTGRRTVGEEQVPPDVKPRGMTPVGNYAVQVRWSDGHDTGIYSWDYLLKLRLEQQAAQA
jgi:DUF971 family protein